MIRTRSVIPCAIGRVQAPADRVFLQTLANCRRFCPRGGLGGPARAVADRRTGGGGSTEANPLRYACLSETFITKILLYLSDYHSTRRLPRKKRYHQQFRRSVDFGQVAAGVNAAPSLFQGLNGVRRILGIIFAGRFGCPRPHKIESPRGPQRDRRGAIIGNQIGERRAP